MVAEFESDLIRLRTKEGMRVAKGKAKLRGNQPRLNPCQEAHPVDLYRQGEYSTAELADLFGVARSTVYRALQRDQVRSQANAHRAAQTAQAFTCELRRWRQGCSAGQGPARQPEHHCMPDRKMPQEVGS
jgi:helix-turn-helix resolvase-like protein